MMSADNLEVPYFVPGRLELQNLQLHVHSNLFSQGPLIINTDENKQIVQKFIQVVWQEQNLAVLGDFWTADCINHAMPEADNGGLDALHAYHESLFSEFAAFSNIQIAISQQIAEADRVVTYLTTKGKHTNLFHGISPTGKWIETSVIRIDRLQDDKIAEHWSVANATSLMQQLQT